MNQGKLLGIRIISLIYFIIPLLCLLIALNPAMVVDTAKVPIHLKNYLLNSTSTSYAIFFFLALWFCLPTAIRTFKLKSRIKNIRSSIFGIISTIVFIYLQCANFSEHVKYKLIIGFCSFIILFFIWTIFYFAQLNVKKQFDK